MSPVYAQRVVALAAAALLVAVFAVAVTDARSGGGVETGPQPAVGPWGGWTTALAGVASVGARTGESCGWRVSFRTAGVVHPVLPCGARLFLEYGETRVLTAVVERGPVPQGHELDVTPRLASRLGLDGVRELRWAYAR